MMVSMPERRHRRERCKLVFDKEGMLYPTQLRRFLLRHPLLVIELGFHLVLDPAQPYGFDVEQTVTCEFWPREKLRRCDPTLFQALLNATVQAPTGCATRRENPARLSRSEGS